MAAPPERPRAPPAAPPERRRTRLARAEAFSTNAQASRAETRKKNRGTRKLQKIKTQKIFTSLFRAPQTMPRKKKGEGDATGTADVRTFFTTTTPLRDITNTTSSAQRASTPPLRTAPAQKSLKFGQIQEAARTAGSAAVRRRITQRSSSPASDEGAGEAVEYSGNCLCAVHHLSAFSPFFCVCRRRRRSRPGGRK